jgi:hypothetical protein
MLPDLTQNPLIVMPDINARIQLYCDTIYWLRRRGMTINKTVFLKVVYILTYRKLLL